MSLSGVVVIGPIVNMSCQMGPVSQYCEWKCKQKSEPFGSCPAPMAIGPNPDPGGYDIPTF